MGRITVIGGGLAGCEAAWQLAGRGLEVELVEMKPTDRSPAHSRDSLAELVCSNSLRAASLLNAVGLLKEEMRRLGSLVMTSADATAVPAGAALAVDREAFSRTVTAAIDSHPRIVRRTARVDRLPPPEVEAIVATGPLTADALAADLARVAGAGQLHFYDAIAPIVSADSLDLAVLFAGSRYDKGGDDYLNCPLDHEAYTRFVAQLLAAECAPLQPGEEPRFFAGCQPLEVIAAAGPDSLRFGPFKPVGLRDPRTNELPHAVVQLRREDRAGRAYNLVGCQTKLKHDAQRRLFRTLPGLAQAEFLRLGAVHRNTYLNAPALLDARGRLRARPSLRFAGQLTGVEGYVESAAHGLVIGLLTALERERGAVPPPPAETALGALVGHVRGAWLAPGRPYEPQNVHWGLFPPLGPETRRSETQRARVLRAQEALSRWAAELGLPLGPAGPVPETRKNPHYRGRRRRQRDGSTGKPS